MKYILEKLTQYFVCLPSITLPSTVLLESFRFAAGNIVIDQVGLTMGCFETSSIGFLSLCEICELMFLFLFRGRQTSREDFAFYFDHTRIYPDFSSNDPHPHRLRDLAARLLLDKQLVPVFEHLNNVDTGKALLIIP